MNKEVVSVDSGDFNGDGKPDLVFYGTPAEVEILFCEGPGRFGSPKKINTGDAVERASALTVGDLDQDGRDDIALLAEHELVFVYQTAPGTLSEPERVPHTADNPWLIRALDVDGDGAKDLLILDTAGDHPIHIRFATPEKKLGPEQRFAVEVPRAIAFGPMDETPGSEILTIENQSGRARVLTLDRSGTDEANKRGRMAFFALPQGNERGPFAGPRRPRRRRPAGRRGHRPVQRTGLGVPPVGPFGPGRRADLPQPDRRADGPPRRPRRRPQGRGLRHLRAGEADRPQRLRPRPVELPDAAAHHRRAGRDGPGRPRRRHDARDPVRRAHQARRRYLRAPRPDPREVRGVPPLQVARRRDRGPARGQGGPRRDRIAGRQRRQPGRFDDLQPVRAAAAPARQKGRTAAAVLRRPGTAHRRHAHVRQPDEP